MAMTSGSIILIPFICGVVDGEEMEKGGFRVQDTGK